MALRGYDASLESLAPKYDVEHANQLLADAGYENGFNLTINVSNTEERKTLATMLQGYWMQIGVNAQVAVNEWGLSPILFALAIPMFML